MITVVLLLPVLLSYVSAEAMITTRALTPTTTERQCFYEIYNETDIKVTDISVPDFVHLLGEIDFCKSMCANSFLSDGRECWAITYNETDKCNLYYSNKLLNINEVKNQEWNQSDVQLFLKRCSEPGPTQVSTTEGLGYTILRPIVTPNAVNTNKNVTSINATGDYTTETSTGGSTQKPEGPCRDKLDNCDYYEDEACVGVYEPWAKANCALRCQFCDYKVPCYDRKEYCHIFDLETACKDFPSWSRYNCKKSCNLCPS